MQHDQIAACFNQEFHHSDQTQLLGGAAEPLYVPAWDAQPARLYYREDYAASALHEAAHWCIAGKRRRQQADFGYRYQPPPRSVEAQQEFFALELRTQALENLFAQAAGLTFRASADNLDADVQQFSAEVELALPRIQHWLQTSSDDRARRFLNALAAFNYGENRESSIGKG